MTTNGEWLFSKPFEEQVAWMNAEHQDGTLDGDTVALEAEYGKGGLVGGSFIDIPEQGEVVMPLESWREYLGTESENADSREQLEADVYRAADEMDRFYCGEKFIDTRKIIGWLDRQAAITESECLVKSVQGADAILIAECAELQAQVDELQELNEYHALQYELASEDADRLQAQVDRLTAERERYREKFGKCIDYADAIHALMDDEGMA